MATYYSNNFESEVEGSAVAGWANVAGTWKAMTRRPTDGSLSFSSDPGAENDITIYTGSSTYTDLGIKTSTKMVANDSAIMGLVLRSNADCSSAYLLWPYNLLGSLYLYAFKRNGTSWTQVGSASGVIRTITSGQTIHVRANLVGQALSVKVWEGLSTEPGTSTWTTNFDNTVTSAGYVGLWYPSGAANPNQTSVDQVEFTNTVVSATALSYTTNPTGGNVGSASSNFTLTTNGALTSSVIITPSDSGDGGTFTPASLTFNAGTTTGSFTYTANSAGSKTISVTNNGGLSNPSNITYNAVSTAATAISFTANPTNGYVSSPSSNFSIGVNGTLSGNVIVTPSDGGSGGTFTPTAITLSTGTTTGSFTYTANSVGNKTISITNNGGLSNPSNITYTASVAPSIVAVDNSNLVWSTANWDLLQVGDLGVSNKCQQSALTGAYLKFKFSGCTSLHLNFDPSTLPASGLQLPRLRIVLNNQTETTLDLNSSITSYQVSNSLNSGTTYECFVQIVATDQSYGNRWGSGGVSPTNIVRITGIQMGSGGSLLPPTVLPNGKGIVFGDSLVEGVQATTSLSYPTDRARSFAQYLGMALSSEYGTVGFGGQGWDQVGNGSVPIFPSTWNYHSSGRSRDLTGLTWVVVAHGTNGSVNSTTVQTWLTNCRASVGSLTWIFILVPPGGFGKANLTSAVNSYIAANPSDTKVKLIDVSDIISTKGMDAFYSGTYSTTDGIHMRDWMHGYFGGVVARKVIESMGGFSGGGGTYPPSSAVLSGVSYGPNSNEYTGVITLPSASQVINGVAFGANLGVTGNVSLPSVSDVRTGVSYGALGTQYTGNLVVGTNDPWDSTIEGSITAREMMRLMGSVLLGKSSGMNTNSPVFRDVLDTKARVTASVDQTGNRTSVSVDYS